MGSTITSNGPYSQWRGSWGRAPARNIALPTRPWTIARYRAEGTTVSLVTMTRGGAGLWNGRAAGDLRQLTDVRELELRDAARELGVAFLEIFDYPDGALEKVEEVEGVKERFVGDLVRCFRSHRPQVVVTFGPEGTYGHPDHKVVSRMTVRA